MNPPTSQPANQPDTNPVFDDALELLRRNPPPGSPPREPVDSAASPPPAPPADPLPARMLNEFVYCPRLFYYEFVEGIFVENADTVRGSAIHARVDQGKGDLPPARKLGTSDPSEQVPPGPAGSESTPSDVKAASGPAEETIHSRSVTLGSTRLGVIAKMDLVEVRVVPGPGEQGDLFTATEVCPVDYKAGSPREGADANELWPTDRMQLGIQMLVLRDNGYSCSEGVIYYRATRQRVRLQLTAELESWIKEQTAAARAAMKGPIPPPLDGSPKCVRCSLAPVCLPDETRLLARATESVLPAVRVPPRGLDPAVLGLRQLPETEGSSPAPGEVGPTPRTPLEPIRRLMAPRDDSRALYLNTPGLRVGRKDEVLQVKDESKVIEEIRIMDLHHVALFGNIQLTTQAIHALCDAGVPITYFSGGAWFYGITRGHDLKNVFTRIEQFRLAADPDFARSLATRFVHGKIRNHRTLLMRNHIEAPAPVLARLKRAADDALRTPAPDQLLGLEGSAAAVYFEHFGGMLKSADAASPEEPASREDRPLTFDFNTRNRRPPADPVNAMLSFAYSLLAKDCTLACHAVGFDPYVGFYHQPRFGRPALALDLMEEFRPLVAESTVLSAVNNRVITSRDFVRAGQSVNLTAPGRKKFLQVYEQRITTLLTHPVFDYKVSYRRAIELQARILARVLTGEIPEYLPLTTR